jgi:hypothetical protein
MISPLLTCILNRHRPPLPIVYWPWTCAENLEYGSKSTPRRTCAIFQYSSGAINTTHNLIHQIGGHYHNSPLLKILRHRDLSIKCRTFAIRHQAHTSSSSTPRRCPGRCDWLEWDVCRLAWFRQRCEHVQSYPRRYRDPSNELNALP